MITYMHLPLVATAFVILLSMWRFWSCIARMGFMREVGQRAPMMLQRDLVAAVFAFMPIVLTAADWLGLNLPSQSHAMPSLLAVALSIGGLAGCIFILAGSGERLAGHWAGTRESALRTVAALRIIDAAELAFALQYAHAHEARHQAISAKSKANTGNIKDRP